MDDEDGEKETQEIEFELPEEETDDSEIESGQSADRETKSKNSIAGISLEEMKRLSDDQYFRLFMKMALKKKKPFRVRLPAMQNCRHRGQNRHQEAQAVYTSTVWASL